MTAEIPQALRRAVDQIKETPSERKKLLIRQLTTLSNEILEFANKGSGLKSAPPVEVKVGDDDVYMRLLEVDAPSNEGSGEATLLEMAVNARSLYQIDAFRPLFEISQFGVINKLNLKPASIRDLEQYIPILAHYQIELEAQRPGGWAEKPQ